MTEGGRAELIVINGKIVTLDRNDSIVSAVAVAEGKFVAVGSEQEIMRRAGAETRRIAGIHAEVTITGGRVVQES
ncbi:MAG: hypothetical protein KKB37_14070 [Alphaproteobacteria bacterium]|nr:hypothetical protein [Alphaproteobacteria bacterium]